MKVRFHGLALVALTLAGCAADAIPPPSSPDDPANPAGPEAPLAPVSAALDTGAAPAVEPAAPAPAPDHHHHHHHPPAGGTPQ